MGGGQFRDIFMGGPVKKITMYVMYSGIHSKAKNGRKTPYPFHRNVIDPSSLCQNHRRRDQRCRCACGKVEPAEQERSEISRMILATL